MSSTHYSSFTVDARTRYDRRRTIEVRVYKEIARMRSDAEKWAGDRDDEEHAEGHFDDAIAVTHAFVRLRQARNGTLTISPLGAIMRLAEDRLSVNVVAHEVLHAVAGIMRDEFHSGWSGDGIEVEENACYLAGDFTQKILSRLAARGHDV